MADNAPTLLVGLGNPGAKYAQNRHNIGFMVADALASAYPFSGFSSKFQGEVAQGTIAEQKCILLKPQTYMNESGRSVGEACRFYKIPPEKVIVFYDELDLVFGKIRVKQGGGHGGHNGLRSLDAHIGKEYIRVRIGIDHPGHKDRVTPHVLGDFNKAEAEHVKFLCDDLARNADILLKEGAEAYMTKIALVCPPPSAKKKPTE